MNLNELSGYRKIQYRKGETFWQLLGARLLTDGRGHVTDGRRVSPSAKVRTEGTNIVLRLFDTDIAIMPKDGGIILDSGGWRTRFTRQIIDSLLPKGLGLTSVDGLWQLFSEQRGRAGAHCHGFCDGCVVHEDASFTGVMTPAQWTERRALLAKSKRFVHRYVDRLLDGEVPRPSAGDCLYCQNEAGLQSFRSCVLLPDGTTRQHTPEEQGEHVRSHIQEGYFCPSMLHNAIKEHGREQLPLFVRWALQYRWTDHPGPVTDELFTRERKHAGTQLRKILSNYVKRRVGCEFGGRGWQSRPWQKPAK